LEELDYALDEALIAHQPTPERDGARLMVLGRDTGAVSHARMTDLPGLLPQSLLIANDTRVIPARLRGTKTSGGKAEIFLVEPLGDAPAEPTDGTSARWIALGRANKPLRPDTVIDVGPLRVHVLGRRPDGMLEVRLEADGDVRDAIARAGEVPLPPYIRRPPSPLDQQRYQTVFAREEGAVAAPTAGLHLSERLLAALEEAGHRIAFVTLHVGPGTFLPVKTDDLDAHPMHTERYRIDPVTVAAIAEARAEARPVVAVGTTVVRALESAAGEDRVVRAGSGATDLLIQPGFVFRVVDALLTNFHLPRSTLLALVMAFGGVEPIRRAYAEAVAARYRFFSYGDAMLIRGDRG
jgi:S-adenosylmethionine:tRNA ribosyltransferase-isomerase